MPRLITPVVKVQKYYVYLYRSGLGGPSIRRVPIAFLNDTVGICFVRFGEVTYIQVKPLGDMHYDLRFDTRERVIRRFAGAGEQVSNYWAVRPECMFVPLQNLMIHSRTRQFVISRSNLQNNSSKTHPKYLTISTPWKDYYGHAQLYTTP